MGPGDGVVVNFTDLPMPTGLPHDPSKFQASTNGFGKNGPMSANGHANVHFGADVKRYQEGDFGLDEILFRRTNKNQNSNSIPSDMRYQTYETLGLTALNFKMNNDPDLIRELSALTAKEAANVFRFFGVMAMENDVAMQRSSDDSAELVATVVGQKYMPNLNAATSREATMEGDSSWLLFLRLKRPRFTGAIGSWDLEENEVAKENARLRAELDKKIMDARVAAGAPPQVAGAQHPIEDAMYQGMIDGQLAPRVLPTFSELFPPGLWDEMCSAPDPNRLYDHLWVPYHSRDGTPPDMSIYGHGEAQYFAMFQHAIRGDNDSREEQVKCTRAVVFPEAPGNKHRTALAKVDRAEFMLRIRQPI